MTTPLLVIEVGHVLTIEVGGERLVIEAAGRPHSPLAHAPAPDDGTDSGLEPVTHLGEVVTHLGFVVWARTDA